VPQQFLNPSQVGAALQQMRRERVPERMRADAEARAALRDILPQESIDAAPGDATPSSVDEEWLLIATAAVGADQDGVAVFDGAPELVTAAERIADALG